MVGRAAGLCWVVVKGWWVLLGLLSGRLGFALLVVKDGWVMLGWLSGEGVGRVGAKFYRVIVQINIIKNYVTEFSTSRGVGSNIQRRRVSNIQRG